MRSAAAVKPYLGAIFSAGRVGVACVVQPIICFLPGLAVSMQQVYSQQMAQRGSVQWKGSAIDEAIEGCSTSRLLARQKSFDSMCSREAMVTAKGQSGMMMREDDDDEEDEG